MAELKTKKNDASVGEFLAGVDAARQADCAKIVEIMSRVTGEPATMWGASIVGFGQYTYKYASGRQGDWMAAGFSPRKANLTLYIMSGFSGYDDLMAKLGKHSTGKSCLYVKRLADIDLIVLEQLVRASVDHIQGKYGK